MNMKPGQQPVQKSKKSKAETSARRKKPKQIQVDNLFEIAEDGSSYQQLKQSVITKNDGIFSISKSRINVQ